MGNEEGAPEVNTELLPSMELASHGDREGMARFYRAFLSGPLFVPDRYQDPPLPASAEYPNDLVHVLGVRVQSRTLVPCFSSPDLLAEWSGRPLSFKTMTGQALLGAVPDEWWLCLNPGQEVEKEFSPWEITELRAGPESIPEVIDDLLKTETVRTVETVETGEADHPQLRAALREQARSEPAIAALYLLRERGEDAEGNETSTLLLGVAVSREAQARLEQITEALRTVARQKLIGDEEVRVLGGVESTESLMLRMFENSAPFYRRKGGTGSAGILSKLRAVLGKRSPG